MNTGFYNLKGLTTQQLRAFYRDALRSCTRLYIESKYTDKNPSSRGYDDKYCVTDFLKMVSKKNHNVCVDRSVQLHHETRGEVGFKLHTKYDPEWYQITFDLSLPRFNSLIEKYGLHESHL